MTQAIPSCMGGWCTARARCQLYHRRSRVVAERLCPKGDEMPVEFMARPPQTETQPEPKQEA